jgi:hypothetical protein
MTPRVDETSKDDKTESNTSNIGEYLSNKKNPQTGNFTNFEKFLKCSLITTPRIDETSKDNKTESNSSTIGEYRSNKKLPH